MDNVELVGWAYEWATKIVFWCSIASLVLAVFERWANQWFPNTKVAWVVSAVTDLVNQFGALNLRDRIRVKTERAADKPAQP